MADENIAHISDTALLVAAARAAETSLEDGLVRVPYADRLAGQRGFALPAVERLRAGALSALVYARGLSTNTPQPSPDDPSGVWLFKRATKSE